MHYRDIAICKLISCNYHTFIPLNSMSKDLVIVINSQLKLCIVKKTSDTGKNVNVLFQDTNFDPYSYIIAVDVNTVRCWLIPVENLDLRKNSLTLAAFAQEYSLVPQNNIVNNVERNRKTKTIKKEVKKVIGTDINDIPTAKTNEDVMKLLE